MDRKTELDHAPNPVDVHVGLQVRLRRKELKISQEKLAETLGLTFQQVQKYERGANRISASKLYEIGWFFEGLSDPAEGRDEGAPPPEAASFAHNFLLTQEGIDLANLFPKVQHRRVRRRLVDLIRSLSEEEPEAES